MRIGIARRLSSDQPLAPRRLLVSEGPHPQPAGDDRRVRPGGGGRQAGASAVGPAGGVLGPGGCGAGGGRSRRVDGDDVVTEPIDIDPEAAAHEAARIRQWYIHATVAPGHLDAVAEFEREFPELAKMAQVWGAKEVTC
jgi:hypothetical protein